MKGIKMEAVKSVQMCRNRVPQPLQWPYQPEEKIHLEMSFKRSS